jgi:SPP1 gp7 family putative phage head morphogenesis protein
LIDKIAQDLYDGKIKASDLNQVLITKTYNDLSEGAEKGVGKSWTTLYKKDGNNGLVTELKKNLYTFASAKNYAQLETFNKMLYYQDGTLRPFNEYSQLVKKSNAQYNKHWLQAEYQTAITAGQMAIKWQRIQRDKDLFPNLKYRTVGDERVREEHAALNGIIKPVDDPFWGSHYPPNGWRCRCDVVQTAEGATKEKVTLQPNPDFVGNVGTDEEIFTKNHKFFKILKTNTNALKNAELAKLNAPYALKYEAKGKKLLENIYADKSPEEYPDNYAVGKAIVDVLRFEVKLRPHINSSYVANFDNPEYEIKGKIGDRKSPKGLNFRRVLNKANDQGCEFVVIHLKDNPNSINVVVEQLKSNFRFDTNYPKITDIIIVSKDLKEVKHYTRKDLKKKKGE